MYLCRMAIEIARRENARLRAALTGTSGSGKTMTSLFIAAVLAAGKSVGLIDSEKRSAALYIGEPGVPEFSRDTEFEAIEEPTVTDYIRSIHRMAAAGIQVLIIDTISHAWFAALDAVDRGGGWGRVGKTVTPQHRKLFNTILTYPGHVICTMRSDTKVEFEKDEKGKIQIRKLGLQPLVRNGTEYEFTVVIDLDRNGTFTVSKSRCGDAIPMDETFKREQLPAMMEKARLWLSKGAPISLRSEALERIKFASDLDALSAVVPWLKAEAAARPLTEAERDELKTAITQKKAALMDDVVPE